jgi:hypothetical protein
MSTRLSDPVFAKLYVDARIQTLRGGRPLRRGRRVVRPN